jgi:hypothetical protein
MQSGLCGQARCRVLPVAAHSQPEGAYAKVPNSACFCDLGLADVRSVESRFDPSVKVCALHDGEGRVRGAFSSRSPEIVYRA